MNTNESTVVEAVIDPSSKTRGDGPKMHSPLKADIVVGGSDEDEAAASNFVFRDPAGVRWTRLRILALAVGTMLAVIAGLFALSFVPRQDSASTGLSRSAEISEAMARAATLAYIPDVPQTSEPISPRSNAGDAWDPHALHLLRRFGWVDPADDEAMKSLQRHAAQLTDVVFDGVALNTEDLTPTGEVSQTAIEAARSGGARVLVEVEGSTASASMASDLTAMARGKETRAAWAASVARKVAALHADGVVLELPDDDVGDPDSEARVALLEDLRNALALTQTLAVAVGPDFDPGRLRRQASSVDLVLVRAHRDAGDRLPPGPLAPRDWLDLVLGAAVDSLGSSKVVPMLTVRSAAWTLADVSNNDSRSVTWAEAMTKASIAGIDPRWVESLGAANAVLPGAEGLARTSGLVLAPSDKPDTAAWLVWLTDAASFTDGLALVRARNLSQVGLDELGGEDPRVWHVLSAASSGRQSVRSELLEVLPPESWQVVGDGVQVRVRSAVRPGRSRISLSSEGFVSSERFDELPTQVTIERRAPAPPGRIALTFDDGPDPLFTPQVLDVLGRHGVKATFFLVGTRIDRDPEIIQRLIAEGHELGNHSFSHPDFGLVAERNADLEIRATNMLIASVTGRSTLLFRPPFRADDTPQSQEDLAGIEAAMRNGMTVVASTIDPRDWERPGADAIVDRVLSQAAVDGSGVVLLHDGGGNRAQTVEALEPMLQGLQARGFSFVQIHDLFGSADVAHTNPSVPTILEVRANQAVWWSGTWLIRILRLVALGALVLVAVRVGAMTSLSVAYGLMRRRARRTLGDSEQSLLPAASVVIPAYNEEKVIVRTVESVLASRDVAVEVLVVDDGSTDDTAGVVNRRFGRDVRVRCIRLKNGGKARALNHGFRRASHEIVVALDADTIFLPDTVLHLVSAMRDPRVAAVAGRAVVGNPRGFIGRCQALEYVCGQAVERRAWAALGLVSVVPGAVGAWRRDAVLMAGGFARDTLAEDSDITIGLQVLGWHVAYAPDAVALTEAPESVAALLKQRFRWTFGVLQTLWKHKSALVQQSTPRRSVRWLLLPTILTCHLGVPLIAPAVDLAGLMAIYLGYGRELVPCAVAMFSAELFLTLAAMVTDRASPRIAWDWLAQRAVYRWILFFALLRAVGAALRGGAVGWNKLARTGTVHAMEAAA